MSFPDMPFKASPRGGPRLACHLALFAGVGLALAGCKEEPAPEAGGQARPVRSVMVTETLVGETVSLAGTIESQIEADLGFRIGGRMIERLAGIGDQVETDQVVARLDPADEENGLSAAEASLSAAEGQMSEARINFDRQRQLYDRGVASRAAFDRAETELTNAVSRTDSARAQYLIARRRLNDTELRVDAPGRVTAIGAEPGEVVQPGRMIVQIARDGGLDAVFDVPAAILETSPADPEVVVALSQRPTVSAEGRVREVSPRADAVTGTFRVRVGLIEPPAELRLGSTVTGTALFGEADVIEIPSTALTRSETGPAVWLVDPDSMTVSMRDIMVDRYLPASVVVEDGLIPGDIVVTAGVQALRPGQSVRVVE